MQNTEKSILHKLIKANNLVFTSWAKNYEAWVEVIEDQNCIVNPVDVITWSKNGKLKTVQSLVFISNNEGEIAEVASTLLFNIRWILSYNFSQVIYKDSPIDLIATPSLNPDLLNEIEINEDEDQFEEIIENLKLGSTHLEKLGFVSTLNLVAPVLGLETFEER